MPQLLPEPYGVKPLTTTPVVVKDESATLKQYPELYVAGEEPLAADRICTKCTGVIADALGRDCSEIKTTKSAATQIQTLVHGGFA